MVNVVLCTWFIKDMWIVITKSGIHKKKKEIPSPRHFKLTFVLM